jgi:DNA-binding NtrC family response regulator
MKRVSTIARNDEQLSLTVDRAFPDKGRDFREVIGDCERLILLEALIECGWNKSIVTRMLGIPRQSLYNKIAQHKLE